MAGVARPRVLKHESPGRRVAGHSIVTRQVRRGPLLAGDGGGSLVWGLEPKWVEVSLSSGS